MRAREGEAILIGMRGVPEVKLVSYTTPTLSDVELATLSRGLGESQAHRMFRERSSAKADGGDDVLRTLPDNLPPMWCRRWRWCPAGETLLLNS